MRITTAAISSLLLLSTAANAFAQPVVHGMNKHDASIAQYNYSVPIQAGESGGDQGSLKDDLDNGGATQSAPPAKMSVPASNPAMQKAPVLPNLDQVLQNPAANFTLPSVQGQNVSLNDSLAKGPTLLLFVRGTASPYSVQQLQLMQKNLQQFGILGIQVLAVTSDSMDNLRSIQQRYNFSFPIVSDSTGAIARRYGVLEVTQPTPSLFSINKQAKIVAVQVQSQSNMVFDLGQATLPLRQAPTQASITAPVVNGSAPTSVSDVPELVPVPNDPVLAQPTEMLSDTNDNAPAMPPVPSPRSTKAMPVPDSVPKVKYVLPPSNPDFVGAVEALKSIAI